MRRTASEVLRDLEIRVASLEAKALRVGSYDYDGGDWEEPWSSARWEETREDESAWGEVTPKRRPSHSRPNQTERDYVNSLIASKLTAERISFDKTVYRSGKYFSFRDLRSLKKALRALGVPASMIMASTDPDRDGDMNVQILGKSVTVTAPLSDHDDFYAISVFR